MQLSPRLAARPLRPLRLLPPLASATSGRLRRATAPCLIEPRPPAPPRLRPSPRPPACPPAREVPLPQSLVPKRFSYFRAVEEGVGAEASAYSENTRSEGFAGFSGCRNFSETSSSTFGYFRGSSPSSEPSAPQPRQGFGFFRQLKPSVFGRFCRGSPLYPAHSVRTIRYFR